MQLKDLFVLFLLHNPINQVQISDPCAVNQPQTIILSSCFTVPFIAKGSYHIVHSEASKTVFFLLYLSTSGDSSVHRNIHHYSSVQCWRSWRHFTRFIRFFSVIKRLVYLPVTIELTGFSDSVPNSILTAVNLTVCPF